MSNGMAALAPPASAPAAMPDAAHQPMASSSSSSPPRHRSRPNERDGTAATAATAVSAASTAATSPPRINTVTYRNATIKAQIDTTMMVADVVRQLCANAHLGVQEPPALFALRDEENDDLVEDSNLARKIQQGRALKLTASPLIEAAEIIEKLSSPDDKTVKMATYTLQRLIREPAFTGEFLRRGGLQELVALVHSLNSGNTLAYALTSCQNLLETNMGAVKLQELGGDFVGKVVRTLVSQERINVCRPATAILKRLVLNGSREGSSGVGDGDGGGDAGGADTTDADAGSAAASVVGRPAFAPVYERISREPAFLTTLVHRLSSPDATLCLYSLSLLNSLMRHVTEPLFDEFTTELDKLGTSRAVARLMDSSQHHRGGEEMASSILEYQANVVRVLHRRLRTAVTASDKRHVTALTYIWRQAKIDVEETVAVTAGSAGIAASPARKSKWRRLGFSNENVAKDFASTGWLGLECCESFVRSDPDGYASTILEQINRPAAKRCPWGRASTQVTEILADYWEISSGYTTSTRFLPLLLSFQRVHHLALRFFLRMWNDCGASSPDDFPRVAAMVRSQVKEIFSNDSIDDAALVSWHDVEAAFLESDYRAIRARQMRELHDVDDDWASRASVRGLRNRLYRESFEFVRQQRVQCLLEGGWFRVEGVAGGEGHAAAPAAAATRPSTTLRRTATRDDNNVVHAAPPSSSRPWRFMRLSPNKRSLHYTDAREPHAFVRSGLEDLTERIELSQVSDVVAATKSTTSGAQDEGVSASSTFSLQSTLQDTPLCTLTAPTSWQYAEWIDGLSMLLKGDAATVHTQETAEYIQTLTDIAVKVKLLDLTGEKLGGGGGGTANGDGNALANGGVDPTPPPLPASLDFFFAEL